MLKYIIVTDKKQSVITDSADRLVVSATDFIANTATVNLRNAEKCKVINLCSDYEYLSKGYYVSLLAEARGMRCAPSVSAMLSLHWKRYYKANVAELNDLLTQHYKHPAQEPLTRTYTICFGRVDDPQLEPLARRLFDIFRFPLLGLTLRYGVKSRWEVEAIEPMYLEDLPKERLPVFQSALDHFTGTAWRTIGKKPEKYWLAILHDPNEKLPPSDKKALEKFATIGKKLGLYVEFITKQDYASLLEYDALFIRETTAIDNHTYRFAKKAAEEDIPCIDDATSIIRCCNKVFQYELLEANKIPVPRTVIMDRRMEKAIAAKLTYPAVLKIPDGSFSIGVVKAHTPEELHTLSQELFKQSDIILCQEYIPSAFDWRIGVLNGKPLYACQYFMAKNHWQIYNHDSKKVHEKVGRYTTLPITDVPPAVVEVAVKAAKKIGTGFYGVDMKQGEDGRVVVIEVNDNPSLESGVEDKILGDGLYTAILGRLIEMIEA